MGEGVMGWGRGTEGREVMGEGQKHPNHLDKEV